MQLSHIKVIELAAVLAGPSVGQFLAELGAQVIKIENPKTKGDITRQWYGAKEDRSKVAAYYASVNWGKTVRLLDLALLDHRQQVYELIKEADIVLVSFKPGDQEKLAMDAKTLQALNHRLIYAQISGYGQDNPRVGFDAIIQAETGFMYMNGQADGPPTKMPVALIDILAAHQLKQAILLALLERTQTGKGQLIEVSLYDAAISALANQASNYLNAHTIPERIGSQHPNIVPYGTVFQTKDHKEILLAVGTDKQFAQLCQVLKLDDLAQDLRFQTNPARVKNKAILLPILEEKFAQEDAHFWIEALNKVFVPVGKVSNLAEVFENTAAQKLLLTDPKSNLRTVRQFVCRINHQAWVSLSAPEVL